MPSAKPRIENVRSPTSQGVVINSTAPGLTRPSEALLHLSPHQAVDHFEVLGALQDQLRFMRKLPLALGSLPTAPVQRGVFQHLPPSVHPRPAIRMSANPLKLVNSSDSIENPQHMSSYV